LCTGQVLLLGLVVDIYFSNSNFSVTALEPDMFSVEYHNKLLFLWCPVTETRSWGVH